MAKIAIPIVASVLIAGGGIGYAVHEHYAAQNLASQNDQVTAQLNTTQSQLGALTAKVNELAASNQAPNSQANAAPTSGISLGSGSHATAQRVGISDSRFKKLQSQLDAQGKEIDAQGQEIADARDDLSNTRIALTGSIAKTHDELVVLEKKGERNYFEFDLTKSKDFKHEGPVGISLRKANDKRGYADLMLMVDDRNLQTKHVNLFQPSMFYEPDSPQPIEVVINDISKDHIHGYVSAPKYRKSELDAMASANAAPAPIQAANPGQNSGQGDSDMVGSSSTDQPATTQPATRKKLTVPSPQ